MLRSLVGSEMCIRDSGHSSRSQRNVTYKQLKRSKTAPDTLSEFNLGMGDEIKAASAARYTHLVVFPHNSHVSYRVTSRQCMSRANSVTKKLTSKLALHSHLRPSVTSIVLHFYQRPAPRVYKPTKFQHGRAIRGSSYCDLTNFPDPLFSGGGDEFVARFFHG